MHNWMISVLTIHGCHKGKPTRRIGDKVLHGDLYNVAYPTANEAIDAMYEHGYCNPTGRNIVVLSCTRAGKRHGVTWITDAPYYVSGLRMAEQRMILQGKSPEAIEATLRRQNHAVRCLPAETGA